jgi:hypothetical protein
VLERAEQEKKCALTSARFIIGDTREVLKKLPDQSVDLVLTSPPFLALRSYLPADHPDKTFEVRAEGSPGEFIDALLDVVELCADKLTPNGSVCFEIGDTYSGSGGAGGDYSEGGLREGQAAFDGSSRRARTRTDGGRYAGGYSGGRNGFDVGASNGGFSDRPINGGAGWPLAKSLCLIPELFRISLVYGFNPLTGRQTPSWRARNVIRWVRPNPPVGALGDKFRPATSEMVVVCKSDKRYFDLDAVRVPADEANKRPSALVRKGIDGRTDQVCNPVGEDGQRIISNPAGAPPLDWWSIPPGGYPGSHYAVFPPELCIKPIKAMCPERVCTACGQPSERIVERESANVRTLKHRGATGAKSTDVPDYAERTTTGWTDCGHDAWRPGIVLDPFAGSGTTLMVALGHGRDSVGIDLDERNADLARERVGMWLTVEDWRYSSSLDDGATPSQQA